MRKSKPVPDCRQMLFDSTYNDTQYSPIQSQKVSWQMQEAVGVGFGVGVGDLVFNGDRVPAQEGKKFGDG